MTDIAEHTTFTETEPYHDQLTICKESEMIEDPVTTLKILEYFARDEVGFPANVTLNELMEAFPKLDRQELMYHTICAIENELLIGNYRKTTTSQGVAYNVGFLDGILHKGSEYVIHAGTDKVWKKAVETLEKAGIKVTTTALVNQIPKAIADILGY